MSRAQRRRLSALVRCRHRSRVHPRSALDTAQVGQGRLGWTVTVRGGPGSAVHRQSASKTRVNALTASASRCTASGTRARVKVSLPRGPGAQWRGPQPSTRVRRPGMTAEMQGRENEVSDCANQKTRTAGPAGAKRPIAFRQIKALPIRVKLDCRIGAARAMRPGRSPDSTAVSKASPPDRAGLRWLLRPALAKVSKARARTPGNARY